MPGEIADESEVADITALDSAGRLVVVEPKAGPAGPDAIAQVLAYMGALSGEKGDVRRILVAGDFHKKVILAARAIPSLALRRYTVAFKFEPIQ